ncbi:MAG: glutamate 5-kinase [Clostridia bacterium]|nr:glutamate 5-kinase [Clostridia bacterium]
MINEIIAKSKKILIKIGSNTLSDSEGHVNKEILQNIGEQIHHLIKLDKQVVIVSSGAKIAGIAAINKWRRKEDMHYKQALCAIGQVELMNAYQDVFRGFDLHIGQMLLTRDDFNEQNRTLNMRNTIFTLIDEGVIPIVNENDTVSVEELRIGDNDTLAALTASLWNADLMVMMSDIDGVYNKNPKTFKDAKLIEKIDHIEDLMATIDMQGTSDFGTGGIATKIEAAKRVKEYGIPMILTNGKKKDILKKLLQNEEKATLFRAR